jgi:hypothetical protein
MKSQQLMWHGQAQELPISSKQQPSRLSQTRPAGIPAAYAAIVLAALAFSLVLAYGMASATIARGGYTEQSLRREIEDLRAQTALLRYQIHLAQSSERVQETADRMGLTAADSEKDVDYVLLPHSAPVETTELAAADPSDGSTTLATAVAEFAAGMVTSAGGRAEASVEKGHRP